MWAVSATNVFEWLDIALTLWEPGGWHEIHERPYALDVLGFEIEHGVEAERLTYNRRSLLAARQTQRTVVATHAGFTDLFVPLRAGGRVKGVLVTGPFATRRPDSTEILERWRWLTGRRGDTEDPEFAQYLVATLSVLVLEEKRAAAFQRLVESVASLMAQAGAADDTFAEIAALREALGAARLPEHTWEVARALVDERTSRGWASTSRSFRLRQLGVTRFPDQVVVGLCVDPGASLDPIDQIVRGHAFRRAAVERARRAGDVISGPAGDLGITLVGSSSGSASRARRRLADMAQDLAVLARRSFGFALHVGLAPGGGSLSAQYHAAFAAAESAMVHGQSRAHAKQDTSAGDDLSAIRRELGQLVLRDPGALAAHFNRYLDAVGARSGYRVDVARAHLEAAFERISEAFQETDTLDAKSWSSLRANTTRALSTVTEMTELFSIYRGAVTDIARAMVEPRTVRRDRNLRRAEQHVRQHFAEPLRLGQVARLAGLSPKYFSELFRRRQGVTFESYVMQLRVERARQLLSGQVHGTVPVSLKRVARLSGFSTANYMGRVFKRITRETPLAYRQRVREGLAVVPRRSRDPS
jgi:AraC-like DNA-binding protein